MQLTTILLKGIKFPDTIKTYLSGGYSNTIELHRERIKIVSPSDLLGEKHGANSEDKSYSFEDRNKHKLVFYTSSQSRYEVFDKSGGQMKKGGLCLTCLEEFNSYCIGLPVKTEEHPIQMRDEDNNIRYSLFYVFYTEGEFCSGKCLMTEVEKRCDNRNYRTDTKYTTARSNALKMLTLMFPDQCFDSYPSPLLLASRGGSFSKQQIEKMPLLSYTNRVICIPIKDEYIVEHHTRVKKSTM